MKLIRVYQIIIIITTLSLISPDSYSSENKYIQAKGVIDIRTTFSDGKFDPDSVVRLAKSRGLDAVFFNDHDRMVIEYGIFPFRKFVRKRVERNSINRIGAEKYIRTLKQLSSRFPDMVIIPGSECAPFYYWSGSPLKGNLTAHNHERRLLLIGLKNPSDYEELPILHNGLSLRYINVSIFPILVLLLTFSASALLIYAGYGIYRILGALLSVMAITLLINIDPFRSSPYDPYHGDQGSAPYQLVIDYVNKKGGLCFWNYPETRSGIRKLGPIYVNTPPYPEMLEQTRGYTGFSALYGDRATIIEPGKLWDQLLLDYCAGIRDRPIWGISTSDYHGEGEAGEILGNFVTVFLVKEKTESEILSSMRAGRMYSYRGKYPELLILDDFSIHSGTKGRYAISGEEITLESNPVIDLTIRSKTGYKGPVLIRVIRGGMVIREFRTKLPFNTSFTDNFYHKGKKMFYRIDIKGRGRLLSNPIFVTFK